MYMGIGQNYVIIRALREYLLGPREILTFWAPLIIPFMSLLKPIMFCYCTYNKNLGVLPRIIFEIQLISLNQNLITQNFRK